jgi:hypothetical protein
MATTTPNYGWAVPTSTDLVKDGATAIETLGDAIDASMNTALGTKKAGMVLLNTTTFSAVASQSITSQFSATYDNYRIVVAISAGSTGQFRLALRNGGTDITAANYSNGGLQMRATAANANYNVNGGDAWRLLDSLTTAGNIGLSMDLISPFKTETTKMNYVASGQDGTSISGYVGGGLYNATTSADGFTILITAGTITGTVSTYGYNK